MTNEKETLVKYERKIIEKTLTAAYRGDLMRYDTLGIPIDEAEAYIIYCNDYNTKPRIRGVDQLSVRLSSLPEDQWITPETMSQEHKLIALLQYAHDFVYVKGWEADE